MKKYVFESLKFFCAAILCTILSAFTSPSWGALPSGYTELEYIESTGTQWINTGIIPTQSFKAQIDFATNNRGSFYILQSRSSTAATIYGISGSSVNATLLVNYSDAAVNAPFTRTGTEQQFYIDFEVKNGMLVANFTNKTTGETSTQTGTYDYIAPTANMGLFGNTADQRTTAKIYDVMMYQNDALVRNFIPAKRNSDNVLGMYDLVSGQFFTNAGTGEFIAGAPVTDNSCRNLFNKNNLDGLLGGYIQNATVGSTTQFVPYTDGDKTIQIKVKPNTTYTITRRTGISNVYDRFRVATWNGVGDASTANSCKMVFNKSSDTTTPSATFTTLADTEYVFINVRNSGTVGTDWQTYIDNFMLEQGSTATPYQPYNPSCGCDGTVVNYTSATGTVSQSGTPTPDNPIDPVFYQQGNMILRKVGDYADTYDATTGKITRRVGVKVFDGTEEWTNPNEHQFNFNAAVRFAVTSNTDEIAVIDSHFRNTASSTADGLWYASVSGLSFATCLHYSGTGMRFKDTSINTLAEWKQWLAQQYAAGTPVTAWYPLAEETTEDWPASYCETPIKIATTKYNETAFGPLNTALANAISVVDSVVSNTITQAGRIADLQAQKQTRPNDIADDNEKCPAGKKCLLVEDASGIPHWYEIVTSILPDGYTELQYIESNGTQYIDTGITLTNDVSYVANIGTTIVNVVGTTGIIWQSGSNFQIRYYSNEAFNITDGFGFYVVNTLYKVGFNVDKTRFCKDDLCVTKTRDIVNNSTRIKTGVNDIIASLKIYDNGTLVRDFVPVKNADGKIGMYDLANGVFYENAGTGEFIAGDPVSE